MRCHVFHFFLPLTLRKRHGQYERPPAEVRGEDCFRKLCSSATYHQGPSFGSEKRPSPLIGQPNENSPESHQFLRGM